MKRGGVYVVDLSDSEVMAGLAAAIALHLLVFALYAVYPREPLDTMEVKTLTIRLGDPNELFSTRTASSQTPPRTEAPTPEVAAPQAPPQRTVRPAPEPKMAPSVEESSSMQSAVRLLDEEALQKAFEQSLQDASRAEAPPAPQAVPPPRAAPVPIPAPQQRTVRQAPHPLTPLPGAGIPGGSTSSDAELLKRYEQTLSLWIQGSHRQWPDDLGLSGVARVALRIDRQGNLRGHWIVESSGNEMLDRMALDMVDDADPMPIIPPNYFPGETIHQFEINIKVSR